MRFVQSPYHSSRGNYNIDLVVIHTTVGYYEGTIKYFQSNDRKVSAHYVVKEDGAEVCQMVDEARAAHHAGIVSNPNPKYAKYYSNGEFVNPNFYSIGIENADNLKPHEWDRTGQYKALAILVRDICKRHNIPIDRNHICGHRELYDKKTCPGNLDVDKIVQMAKGGDYSMDDDTKLALGELQKAKAEFGFGNLESTVRGLTQAQRDIVAIKADLESYKLGEPIRIKSAVDAAITENNKVWQSAVDTATQKYVDLEKKYNSLLNGQASELSWDTIINMVITKIKGGAK